MSVMRLIAGLMIGPMFYMGTGITQELYARAARDHQPRQAPHPHPPRLGGYTIDFDGIRWLKTVGLSVTTYLVDRVQPFQQVLEDRVGGAVTATYVHLDDLVAAAFPATGTRFYHHDGQMSTRKLTDPLAAVTDEYTFDAWGVTLASSGTTPNNYLYTGEQSDPHLGLQYNRARYYALSPGRFLSQDEFPGALAEPSSLHRYLYAANDPQNSYDPSGLTLLELKFVQLIIGFLRANLLTAIISGAFGAAGTIGQNPEATLGEVITAFLIEFSVGLFLGPIGQALKLRVFGRLSVVAARIAAGGLIGALSGALGNFLGQVIGNVQAGRDPFDGIDAEQVLISGFYGSLAGLAGGLARSIPYLLRRKVGLIIPQPPNPVITVKDGLETIGGGLVTVLLSWYDLTKNQERAVSRWQLPALLALVGIEQDLGD
jgi:RHS repeat-associated protein